MTALELVCAYQDAWASKDLAAAAGYLAGDFVFDGPNGRQTSAAAFLPGLTRFAHTIEPGWHRVAALADGDGVAVLYDVTLRTGAPLRCADYFTVRDGRITSEWLVFDTDAFRRAFPEGMPAAPGAG